MENTKQDIAREIQQVVESITFISLNFDFLSKKLAVNVTCH